MSKNKIMIMIMIKSSNLCNVERLFSLGLAAISMASGPGVRHDAGEHNIQYCSGLFDSEPRRILTQKLP